MLGDGCEAAAFSTVQEPCILNLQRWDQPRTKGLRCVAPGQERAHQIGVAPAAGLPKLRSEHRTIAVDDASGVLKLVLRQSQKD